MKVSKCRSCFWTSTKHKKAPIGWLQQIGGFLSLQPRKVKIVEPASLMPQRCKVLWTHLAQKWGLTGYLKVPLSIYFSSEIDCQTWDGMGYTDFKQTDTIQSHLIFQQTFHDFPWIGAHVGYILVPYLEWGLGPQASAAAAAAFALAAALLAWYLTNKKCFWTG